MDKIFILLCMIFMHIFADFNLQGCLSDLKQKEYWKQVNSTYNTDTYKNDWIPSLLAHSFVWSFCVVLPLIAYGLLSEWLIVLFIWNIIIHFSVDNAKCNEFKINLVEDQSLHLIQIIVTWVLAFL